MSSDQARERAAQVRRRWAITILTRLGCVNPSGQGEPFEDDIMWLVNRLDSFQSSVAQACYKKAAQHECHNNPSAGQLICGCGEIFLYEKDYFEAVLQWREHILALAGSPAPANEYVLCPGCSEAGGAEKPIYHLPPICSPAPAMERQITEGLRDIHDETRCNEWMGPFQCWDVQGHSGQCKFDPKREVSSKELLEMVIGSIEGYPDHGGDIGVMNAVKKLVERREAEIRADQTQKLRDAGWQIPEDVAAMVISTEKRARLDEARQWVAHRPGDGFYDRRVRELEAELSKEAGRA